MSEQKASAKHRAGILSEIVGQIAEAIMTTDGQAVCFEQSRSPDGDKRGHEFHVSIAPPGQPLDAREALCPRCRAAEEAKPSPEPRP